MLSYLLRLVLANSLGNSFQKFYKNADLEHQMENYIATKFKEHSS